MPDDRLVEHDDADVVSVGEVGEAGVLRVRVGGPGQVAGRLDLRVGVALTRVRRDRNGLGGCSAMTESNVTSVLPRTPSVQCAAVSRTVGEIRVAEQRK
jgi:hypothetical protein